MATELVGPGKTVPVSIFLNKLLENMYRSKRLSRGTEGWITQEAYLTDSLVNDAFLGDGQPKVGFFSRIQTRLICFDIDAHGPGEGHVTVEKKLERLMSTIGMAPNALEKTRRGIHCFYLLSDYVNSRLMTDGLKSLFSQILLDVEVRGTWNEGLSFPVGKNLTVSSLDEIPSTVFTSLFPERIRSSKPRKALIPFTPGNTNDALCQSVPFLRWGLGLSIDETVKRISDDLPPDYNGELLNRRRLAQRVKSFKQISSPVKHRESETLEDEMAKVLMEAEKRHIEVSNRRAVELRKIVDCLLRAKASFEEDCATKEGLLHRNAENCYSSYYSKTGATPVPSSLLQKVNSHYGWYLKLLLEIGFLKLANGRHYDVSKHVCIHYVIGLIEQVKEVVKLAIEALGLIPTYVLNCLSDNGLRRGVNIFNVDSTFIEPH